MKLKSVFLKTLSLACIGAVLIVSSCKDEDRLTLQDTQDISEESVSDSYFQDMDDMAGVAVQAPEDAQFSGGRVSASYEITINDDRFKCGGIVVTVEPGSNSNSKTPSGILTVNFGATGCADSKGNIRTGKLIFNYTGWRFKPDSKIITTTENYTINGIKLEGIRTLTNVTGSDSLSPKFKAILTAGKATFPDASIATRESNITWQWKRGATVAKDFLLVDQSSEAHGTSRGGRHYDITLAKALTFKRFCGGLPVEGIKKYVIDGDKTILIDYGVDDNTCDRKIVVIVNGAARSLTVD